MSDRYLIVAGDTGLVEAVSIGMPPELRAGRTAYPATAGEYGIGWIRQPDGSILAPSAAASSPEDLDAYAREAHLAAEARGTRWEGWPVRVDERALTRALAEVVAIQLGERADGDPWTFADNVARPLSNDAVKGMSLRMRRHVGVCLAVYNGVVAGIAAGQVATRAQVDAAFAEVDALVLQGAAA